MRERTSFRMPLSAAMSQLYGYIYCMLVSNIVVGMPLFGGALYLCGRACAVLYSVYRRKNRKYLPSYARVWGFLLGGVLIVLAVLLMGLYPAGFQSTKVWTVFAAVALCLCADAMAGRIRKLKETAGNASRRAWTMTILFQLLLAGAATVIMLLNFETGRAIPLIFGFALLMFIRAYSAFRLYTAPGLPEQAEQDEQDEISKLRAYHSFETISLLFVTVIEMSVASIYALLATNTESLLPAIAIGVGCTAVAGTGSLLFLRRSKQPKRQDPTWLLCVGLAICLGAITMCSLMLINGSIHWPQVYICLAGCSVGSTLSMAGLIRIEELMPGVAEIAGEKVSKAYLKRRAMNWELAQLFGDVLALITLSVFCFVNGKELPRDINQLATRFQPLMLVPLLLVIIAAMISAFNFPLSARYIDKLKLFLRLKEKGVENPVLQKRLETVVGEHYRQPWLSRLLMAILRPFYRHKLVNADHIVTDDSNPLVFLCNHGEIYGPIVCKLFIPVPVRIWTISLMMYDKPAVTSYVYENTYSKKTFLPVWVRKATARFIGWLSVNVMSQLESIPVYRDSPMKLRETLRQSIEAMAMGDNILIFPENPDGKYQLGGIGELSPGFLMLAEAYWKKTGKKLRILPMYANRDARTLTFGDIITYEPDNGYAQEQERIIKEARDQICRLAGIDPQATEE